MSVLRPLAVCVAVCALMTVPAAVAAGAFPGANGRIAYWSSWPDDDVCHSSRPDGTRQRRIVRCQYLTSLNFSADGRRIVVARGGWIALARASGRDRSWLVRGGLQPSGAWWEVWWAAFSPDGSQVVFSVVEEIPDPSAPDGERTEGNMYVIGVDGANLRLIARHDEEAPVFSPDGKRIAYIGWRGPTRSVETVAVDGTDRRTLVSNIRALRVDFSPDGTHVLVVESLGRNRGTRIAIVDAQTGDRTRLPARVTGSVSDAVWSPDGRRIAFVPFELGSKQVFTIRPDGTGKRLAFTARVPGLDSLAWQPRP